MTRTRKFLLMLLGASLLLISPLAIAFDEAREKANVLMAVAGDSISAAFISTTISLTVSDPYYTQINSLWPRPDAKTPDATTPDATTLDATTLDATTLDATTLDATTLDATTLDATTLDATTLDATTLDATTQINSSTVENRTALQEIKNFKNDSSEGDDNFSAADPNRPSGLFSQLNADSGSDALAANHHADLTTLAADDDQPFSFTLWLAQFLNHKSSDSWASGEKIYSHFVRLQNYLWKNEPSVQLQIKNFAYSGALTADLRRQANDIVSEWRTGKYQSVRYVTLMIGANDVCSDPSEITSDSAIATHLQEFFEILSQIKQAEPIHVLVSSLPNIPNFAAPEIFNHLLPSGWTCEHKLKNTCATLVSWTTLGEYVAAEAMIQDKNEILKSVSEAMSVLYPEFQIFYSEKFFNEPLVQGRLAEDCFHPDWYGQQRISDLLWLDQPWWHDSSLENNQ